MKETEGGRLRAGEAVRGGGSALTAAGGVLLLASIVLGPGCRGRAEFYRGQDLLRQGQDREAFYQFWEASRQNPSARNLEALQLTGRRVATAEWQEGRSREAERDFEGALGRYAVGLEYDASWALLACDYARVLGWVLERDRLEGELERMRVAAAPPSGARPPPKPPGGGGAWRELEIVLALEAHPASRAGWEPDRAGAARRGIEGQAAALRESTFTGPLPEAPAALRDLAGEWLGLAEGCRGFLYQLEDGLLEEARPLGAAWDEPLRAVLRRGLADAEDGLGTVDRALEGTRLYEDGLQREAEGKLTEALRLYARASPLHPSHEAARDAGARVRRRFAEEMHHQALVALHREEFERAIETLEGLLEFAPGHGDAEQVLKEARRKLAARHVLEARRHQEVGLIGSALVRFYLAASVGGPDPKLEAAIKRLEIAIRTRVRPRVRVAVLASAPFLVSHDPWRVDAETVASLRKRIAEKSQSLLDRLLEMKEDPGAAAWEPAGTIGEARRPGEEVVWVEDLDFSCPRLEGQAGFERVQFVKSLQLVENPELDRARRELEKARLELEGALAAEAQDASGLDRELVTLARWNLRRFQLKLASLAEEAPAILWDERSYPVRQVLREARLSARYRLGDGSSPHSAAGTLRWRDRVVQGDPEHNIPQDPEEIPSPAVMLEGLAAELAENLARGVFAELVAQREDLYKKALERIEARSFDVATENLVLFLYAQQGKEDILFKKAALLLEQLTGCNLPALWVRSR